MRTFVAALLLYGACALVWLAAAARSRSLREGLGLATVVAGAVVALTTQTLSAAHALSGGTVAVGWGAVALVAGADVIVHRRALRALVARRWSQRPPLRSPDTMLVTGVVVLLGILLLVAVLATPNTWDSLTYHLSRVEQWRVRRSVAPYPTADGRENWSGPLAEFAVLHARLLSGGDRIAGCVQWTALCSAVSSASLVAARLGANRRAQVAVVVMAVAAPTVVSEAPTTQNDIVCAAFVLAAVALAVQAGVAAGALRRVVPLGLALGAAGGLALLVKATAVPVLVPFVVWLMWQRRREVRSLVLAGACAVAMAGGLNAAHVVDNLQAYGSLTGPTSIAANTRFGADIAAENAVRYTAMNFATPQWQLNTKVTSIVGAGLSAAGMQANDRDDTFGATRFRVVSGFQEDVAVSFVQVALFLVLALLALERGPMRAAFGSFGVCVVVGFLLFCSTVAWQPWGMRLLVPSLLLAAVPLGRALAVSPSCKSAVVLGLILTCALPWATRAAMRPLTGPKSIATASAAAQRFSAKPGDRAPYAAVVDRLISVGARDVGLRRGGDQWQYPLWALLREGGSSATVRDLELDPAGASRRVARTPDAVVCLHVCVLPEGWMQLSVGSGIVVQWPAKQ